MTYNLKKSIIQWESVCICICLHPRRGSLSAQCIVLLRRDCNGKCIERIEGPPLLRGRGRAGHITDLVLKNLAAVEKKNELIAPSTFHGT